jgi:DNA-binding beta-propeller fold protein YncE
MAFGMVTGCEPTASVSRRQLSGRFFSEAQVIGGKGVAPGQFNKPRSVACDRHDNLYVVDMTGRVQKFSPTGVFLLQWQMPQTEIGKPKGMGLDRDGHVLVLEPHYQRVNHFDEEGHLVSQWGKKGTNLSEFILPRSIAQNSAGDYFVSEYTQVERVQKFNSNHVFLQAWGSPGLAPGEFNRAEGLAIGPKDEVYVCDSCNHRIQIFDSSGHFLRTYGSAGSSAGLLSYPYDIHVESSGVQFVCEFGNSRISVFDAQGQALEVIGQAGSLPGEFANPWGMAFDSHGNMYVADALNHRVQKFIRRA